MCGDMEEKPSKVLNVEYIVGCELEFGEVALPECIPRYHLQDISGPHVNAAVALRAML